MQILLQTKGFRIKKYRRQVVTVNLFTKNFLKLLDINKFFFKFYTGNNIGPLKYLVKSF